MGWAFLRDTTPVRLKTSNIIDLGQSAGETVGSVQIDNVYWRVKMRYVNNMIAQECEQSNYSLFTHKNIELDGEPMKESYIYTCKTKQAVINARTVFSDNSVKEVGCKETYATKTKIVQRKYPFSLKYISGFTFVPETKVVRDPVEACMWLHAIDIVKSRWD